MLEALSSVFTLSLMTKSYNLRNLEFGGTSASNSLGVFFDNKNPNSFIISRTDEINKDWFSGVNSVGISGATSTPNWLMEEVADWVKSNFN